MTGRTATGVADRVGRLLAQLTLPEKLGLLHQYQAPVPRLGLEAFRTGTEALHGLAWLGPATVFPQALGLASSWDADLVRRVGEAVGDEVRGCHHKDPTRAGLNVWAPVVNPLRDPRWGRNEEGYAEDPWLTGVLATAYAAGLRGDHPRYLKTAPTLKHFLGYNHETERDTRSSSLPPRVLHEYELPAYRRPLQTGAAVAVMAAYNPVNDRPAHLSPLLAQVLRKWAGDDLLVVSDAHAPSNLVDTQHYFADHPGAHAAAVRAGLDSFTDHDRASEVTIGRLREALDRALLTEQDIDAAVRRILTLRLRLGEADPPDYNPYQAITPEVINCPAHQALAREAASRSMVLLTHRGLLPLDRGRHRRVALIGPLSDVLYEDWYSGTLPYGITARAGLVERLGAGAVSWCEGVDRVQLRIHGSDDYLSAPEQPGDPVVAAPPAPAATQLDLFDWGGGQFAVRAVSTGRHLRVGEAGLLVADSGGPQGWLVRETFTLVEHAGAVALRHRASSRYLAADPDGTVRANAASLAEATSFVLEFVERGAQAAARIAADADVAVVVLGNHPMVAGRETEDRTGLALPVQQAALLAAVHAANPATVLVLSSSYPYGLGWADAHLPAVLWSAHGGQEYGRALADVLFGDADPAGRLTQTWYASAAELPDRFDYDIIGSDTTYLYYRGTPVYPFGHGHSYARFAYENLQLSADEVDPDGEVTVSVEVVNSGDRNGEEVVQLYTRQLRSRVKQPLRQLRGFARVRLAPGERACVRLPLSAADLAFWDVTTGAMVVEAARHRVMVARSATDPVLSAVLTARGRRIPPRRPELLRATDYDDCFGIVLCDETPVAGDAVRATEPGSWLAYLGVDLPAGPAQLRLRIARREPATEPQPTPAAITLRRDDPLTGPTLAVLPLPAAGGRYAFTELAAAVAGPGGPTDLYLVLDRPGTIVSELRWQPA